MTASTATDPTETMLTGATFASLYCGAGGLDLGFTAAGFQCVAAFDADAMAVATYNRNLGPHATTVDPSPPWSTGC